MRVTKRLSIILLDISLLIVSSWVLQLGLLHRLGDGIVCGISVAAVTVVTLVTEPTALVAATPAILEVAAPLLPGTVPATPASVEALMACWGAAGTS